jgi:hypothetical protein
MMNLLDMRTVMFGHVVTDVVCALVLAFLWSQNRKRFAGIAWWVFDFALQATATILIILRGSIPDWISIVLSNTLVLAGALAGYLGLQRFVGKIVTQHHNYVLLAIFAGVHTYILQLGNRTWPCAISMWRWGCCCCVGNAPGSCSYTWNQPCAR